MKPVDFCFFTVFKATCVNTAVIYILYALKFKLRQRAIPFQSHLLQRNYTIGTQARNQVGRRIPSRKIFASPGKSVGHILKLLGIV